MRSPASMPVRRPTLLTGEAEGEERREGRCAADHPAKNPEAKPTKGKKEGHSVQKEDGLVNLSRATLPETDTLVPVGGSPSPGRIIADKKTAKKEKVKIGGEIEREKKRGRN